MSGAGGLETGLEGEPRVQGLNTRASVSELSAWITASAASILSSVSRADGFVAIPADLDGDPAGANVEVWCYDDGSPDETGYLKKRSFVRRTTLSPLEAHTRTRKGDTVRPQEATPSVPIRPASRSGVSLEIH
jgi:hypothetical protein